MCVFNFACRYKKIDRLFSLLINKPEMKEKPETYFRLLDFNR